MIARNQFKLGREPDNDLKIADNKVSRHHALIERQNDRFYIRDLASTNGTFVDGQRVKGDRLLLNGDKIYIGGNVLIFRQTGGRGPAQPGSGKGLDPDTKTDLQLNKKK